MIRHVSKAAFAFAAFFCLIPILLSGGNAVAAGSANADVTVRVLSASDILYASGPRLGEIVVHPGQPYAAALIIHIENRFAVNKTVSSVTLRDASLGDGSPAEIRSNASSIALFLDADSDSSLTASDSLLGAAAFLSDTTAFSFAPLTIPPGASVTLIGALAPGLYPHDGDSLDLYVRPATDIQTGDGTVVTGVDSVNSQGSLVIDGIVADQLTILSTGVSEMTVKDSIYGVFAVDLPRNGYSDDTLNSFSVRNVGTATSTDLANVALFKDDGDGLWSGAASDSLVGLMEHTGDNWTVSGISLPLVSPTTRLFVGGSLAPYPRDSVSIAFSIPEYGLLMSSRNDGPLDVGTNPADTITIISSGSISVAARQISGTTLIPGDHSGPLQVTELTNNHPGSVSIDSIRYSLVAVDPGGATITQLGSQIDSVLLYNDLDGDASTLTSGDTLIGTGVLIGGECVIATPGLSLEGVGGTLYLGVAAAVSLENARNGNTLGFALADGSDIFPGAPSTIEGSFPVENSDAFTVNAFPAASVLVHEPPDSKLWGGVENLVLLDVELPGDGYADDALSSMELTNAGTLDEETTPIALKLWADVTGDGFTIDDIQVAQFVYDVDRWRALGIDHALVSGHTRMIVTGDIDGGFFSTGTLRLQLPVGGATYLSGTIGPDDNPVGNSNAHIMLPPDRITAVPMPTDNNTVYPGSSDNLILAFALYNGYVGQTQKVQSITFTNISKAGYDQDFADYSVGQVSLHPDTDGDLVPDDSLVATGYFTDGILQMSGLNTFLAPESLSYFFVLADLPADVGDGDSIAISVNALVDMTFSEAVDVNGEFPLTGGAYSVVDGSVGIQYDLLTYGTQTLRPGDSSVTLLAFRPAHNGDETDTLESFGLTNASDADTTDLSDLELWIDRDGDNQWEAGDSMLSALTYQGGVWTAAALTCEIDEPVPVFFVVGNVLPSASPGAVFRAEIPSYACQFSSANDGPIDGSLVSNGSFSVSGAGLSIACTPGQSTYSVGQSVPLRFSATNRLSVSMDSVWGESVLLGDPSVLVPDSTDAGPIQLLPDSTGEFSYFYTATQPGTVSWQLQAKEGTLPDSSVQLLTSPVVVQQPPSGVDVQLVNSMPVSVTRGLNNVVPLSVRLVHADADGSAAVRIDSLRFRIEDDAGQLQTFESVFSKITIMSDNIVLAVLDTPTPQTSVGLHFNQSVTIQPEGETIFTLLVDIAATATANTFALSIADADYVIPADFNTREPVALLPGVSFPMTSEVCRIDDPSQQMQIAALAPPYAETNVGQESFRSLGLSLYHPGLTGSSQIQLTNLSLSFKDALENTMTAASLITEARLSDASRILGESNPFGSLDTMVNVPLTIPLSLSPDQGDSVWILLDIAPDATLPEFSLVIHDSLAIEVRDVSSSLPVDVVTDTSLLQTGSVFPITSGLIAVKQPALEPQVCLVSSLPASVTGGVDSVPLLTFTIDYPVLSNRSSLCLSETRALVLDGTGSPVNPELLFDRIGFVVQGGQVQYQPVVSLQGGFTIFEFGDPGLIIQPGQTVTLQTVADIEADAPYDEFQISLEEAVAVVLNDVTDTTNIPGFELSAGCDAQFPFVAGPTSIFLPAGRPLVTVDQLPVQIAAPGQQAVAVLNAQLDYNSATPEGDLILGGLTARVLRRTTGGLVPTAASEIFEGSELMLQGSVRARDTILDADSLRYVVEASYVLSRGSTTDLILLGDLKDEAPTGNYLVMLTDSLFAELTDKNLATSIFPRTVYGVYPLWSTELSISAADLSGSFTNYPNPFNVSHGEQTTFAYVLPEAAHIDLEIFTTTGAAVITIRDNVLMDAGPHSDDTWSGVNGSGHDVAPGVYFCRITARYASGQTESTMRKVAVVR